MKQPARHSSASVPSDNRAAGRFLFLRHPAYVVTDMETCTANTRQLRRHLCIVYWFYEIRFTSTMAVATAKVDFSGAERPSYSWSALHNLEVDARLVRLFCGNTIPPPLEDLFTIISIFSPNVSK
jgi:hypothetical protein